MTDTVKLEWRGPLMLGNLPTTEESVAGLPRIAIYIFWRCYEGKTLVYAGKSEGGSKKFVDRLYTHFSEVLGCVATQYKEDGTPLRGGEAHEYFRSIQEDLEETLRHAVADARRTRFVYACVSERLAEIEATIILRLKQNLPDMGLIRWNSRQPGGASSRRLVHVLDHLELERLSPREHEALDAILGACEVDRPVAK